MLQRVRIKIEGLREPREALKIAQMGADAIGMVFAESPRWVSPEQARAIVDVLPPWVATVGVFVNADAATINRVVERTRIGYVQLHGDEPPEIVSEIAAPCIKAFRVRDAGWLGEVRQWVGAVRVRSHLAAVLLDAYDKAARGGTGRRFNWDLVADARAGGGLAGLDPILLAGGLDADCVARAIDAVKPWGVDVASGVEKAPGVKDLRKVADFILNTREGNVLESEFWL
ncbi:MAG TPA: phosphoribosylanthranilate isomerase [Phycisphaerae bacterium]|nr:phosphoribosylanthranilate isomerase [Phycisphaerae bacterium]